MNSRHFDVFNLFIKFWYKNFFFFFSVKIVNKQLYEKYENDHIFEIARAIKWDTKDQNSPFYSTSANLNRKFPIYIVMKILHFYIFPWCILNLLTKILKRHFESSEFSIHDKLKYITIIMSLFVHHLSPACSLYSECQLNTRFCLFFYHPTANCKL